MNEFVRSLVRNEPGLECGPQGRPWRVFIVSRMRLQQEGLRHCLSQHPTIKVVGIGSVWTAPQQLAEMAVDIALVDAWGGEDAHMVRRLFEQAPQTKILALGIADGEGRTLNWVEAGISAYVPPEATAEDLIRAIQLTGRGEFTCSPSMTSHLFSRLAALSTDTGPLGAGPALTAREQDIAVLLEQGLSNKEIARRLFIGSATVKNHVHNILTKLQVHRRGEISPRVRAWRPATYAASAQRRGAEYADHQSAET